MTTDNSIDILRSDDTAFEAEYEIEPNESVREEQIIEGGEYQAIITVDTGVSEKYRFSMGDCEEQWLTVRVPDEELVEFATDIC